ncbi:MAG: hypothetical protein J6J42_06310 [Lachnospiraceae bacterium]|nr:hypothetical protein [Lachnospiraceae bacterium]
MNTALIITDISGARVEHSSVIINFVAMVKHQLKGSLCRVFSDNVQYKWTLGDKEKLRIISMPIVKMDFDELFDTEF